MPTCDSKPVRQINFITFFESIRLQQQEGAALALFDQTAAICRELNLSGLLKTQRILARQVREIFEGEGVESYTKRLYRLGVAEETLFLCLLLFTFLPSIDRALRTGLGDVKARRKKARVLDEAAQIMDEMAGAERSFVEEYLQNHPEIKTIQMPREVSNSLHCYRNTLFIGEQLRKAFDLNSGEELAKFTLASAIHRITGRYHDRETAAVLSVFLRKPDYDDTAHRVWRIRTFPRLNPSCSYLPIILHAINSALINSENGDGSAPR